MTANNPLALETASEMAASWGTYGLSRTNILNRPVRTTAKSTLVLETASEMAASDWTDPKLHRAPRTEGSTRVRMEGWRTGVKGNDGYHVGLDRGLPSHGRVMSE